MKFEVTHPKIWKKLAEKNLPMKHKVQIYEKLGGAYRLGKNEGEQVFNKMTELLKNRMNEGDEKTPEETLSGLKNMAMGDLERIADYANMIETRMKEGQELSSWMYSQITLAVDQLNSVHDAMDGKDGEREPMKESVKTKYPLKDGKYQFDVKDGVGYLTYGGKKLSSGDYDWEDGSNSFWMSHSSWGGQKAFDNGKDIINYFKSKRITQP
jgi:hypothetical protein